MHTPRVSKTYMLNTPTLSDHFDSSSATFMTIVHLTVSMSQLNGDLTRQTMWCERFTSNAGGGSATAPRREENLPRRRSRSCADGTSPVPSLLFDAGLLANDSQARRSGSTMAADLRTSVIPPAGSKVWHRSPAHFANVISQSPL